MEDFHKKFALSLLSYAAQRGVDAGRLCALSDIDYKDLQKLKGDLTPRRVDLLWKNLAHLSNDDCVGLHFGESMQLAALGVVGQIVQTSNTVGEALTHACAFVALVTDAFEMKIESTNKAKTTVRVIPNELKAREFPNTYRHLADYLLVFTVLELKGLLLEKVAPLAVSFSYPLTNASEYTRIFQCPISTKNNELSLVFSSSVLNHRILSADYELQNFLLQKVESWFRPAGKGGLQAKIYNYLLANSYLHSPSLEAVAANFSLSTRSLQRKLKEEGVTFLEIVEEVRKALAVNFLSSGHHSVKDVSNRLGYNEPSAFVRAFKRWTNLTPAEFQKGVKRKTKQ